MLQTQAGSKMRKEAQSAHLGVVVLSPHFFVKGWPVEELRLMLSDSVRTREGRFIPLFYKVHVQTAIRVMLCQVPSQANAEGGLRAQVSAHDCEDIDRALRYHATEPLLPPGAESSARFNKRRALQVNAVI